MFRIKQGQEKYTEDEQKHKSATKTLGTGTIM